MALSMFQASVPVITQLLNGLSGVVDKTVAHIAEKKYDEQAFLQARLFPDMFTLGRQIRQATDFGRNAQYGSLLTTTYLQFGGGGATVNLINNFRQIISNPCLAGGNHF